MTPMANTIAVKENTVKKGNGSNRGVVKDLDAYANRILAQVSFFEEINADRFTICCSGF